MAEPWEPQHEMERLLHSIPCDSEPESAPNLSESAVALEPRPSPLEAIDGFLERNPWPVVAGVLSAFLGFILWSSISSGAPLFHWDSETPWDSTEWELDKLERRTKYPQADPRYRRQRPGGPGRSRWDDTTA